MLPALYDCAYNQGMRIVGRHSWRVTTAEAKEIQLKLAAEVVRTGSVKSPRLIAGVDVSVDRWRGTGRGAVVVLSYPALEVVEMKAVTGKVTFPYVPGLLSFREIPLLLPVFEEIENVPDLVLVDGQGIAHPRRIGLAAHLGLCLGIPTVGCAKSRLIGEHGGLAFEPGARADLLDNGEVIGAVVRTRAGVKPVYVSTGHMIDLEGAVYWVEKCCRGYRLPEPTRLAHRAAGGFLKVKESTVAVKSAG
ncbi:MAG: deoxyribonuclease V [Dehalococcoidales bacterium]|jgi:deoxyribonuclease V